MVEALFPNRAHRRIREKCTKFRFEMSPLLQKDTRKGGVGSAPAVFGWLEGAVLSMRHLLSGRGKANYGPLCPHGEGRDALLSYFKSCATSR